MTISKLEKIRSCDPGLLRAAVAKRRPIIIKGLIDDWLGSHWDFEKLTELMGAVEITALINLPRASGGKLEGGQQIYESTMYFRDFVRLVHEADSAPCYLGYFKCESLVQCMNESFPFSTLANTGNLASDTRLWVGSKGTCSGLHSDLKDNFFVQIKGNKLIYLAPFEDSPYLYPCVDNIVNSPVDLEWVDYLQFPKVAQARIVTATMCPGDLIFIPKGWWHYLKSESASISVNHWFGLPVSAREYLRMLIRLGSPYVSRAMKDMIRYGVKGEVYHKDFFFTPVSTGERLYNYLRYGDFSKENDPAKD